MVFGTARICIDRTTICSLLLTCLFQLVTNVKTYSMVTVNTVELASMNTVVKANINNVGLTNMNTVANNVVQPR